MQVGRRSAVVLRKSAAGQHKQGSDPHHFLSLFFSFFVFFAFSFLLFAYLFSRSTLNRLRVQGVLVLITDGSSTASVCAITKKRTKKVLKVNTPRMCTKCDHTPGVRTVSSDGEQDCAVFEWCLPSGCVHFHSPKGGEIARSISHTRAQECHRSEPAAVSRRKISFLDRRL